MHLITRFSWALLTLAVVVMPGPVQAYLQFDGSSGNWVELMNSSNGDFSISTTHALTVSVWIRPDTLCFSNVDSSRYVNWLGKGCRVGSDGTCVSPGGTPNFEWTFRMYSQDNTEGRNNRISFYVFALGGGEGNGSYFQDVVEVGEWIHVVAAVDDEKIYLYKNGVFRKCDQYIVRTMPDNSCQQYPNRQIDPAPGSAPVRIGHRDANGYFQGGIARVRIWNSTLSAAEVASLYFSGVVPARDHLVAEYLLDGNLGDTADGHDGSIVGNVLFGSDPEPGP